MAGPAKSGVLIYCTNLERLMEFYITLIEGAQAIHVTNDLAVIDIPDGQLIIHVLPPEIAEQVEPACAEEPRPTAVKAFVTVQSMAHAEAVTGQLGGRVFPQRWQGAGFVIANACDPEGNMLQLREFTNA